VVFGFAHALDVDLLCFTEFTAVLALSDGTTLLLNLKEGAVGVFAGRGAMAFDACFAGVFFIADKNHCVMKWERFREKAEGWIA
jgi:hypothetical protein